MANLLAIDVGNTSSYAGFFENGVLRARFRYATVASSSADSLALTVVGMLELHGLARADVSAIALSTVVPPLGRRYVEMGERHFGMTPFVLTASTCGTPVSYDPPTAVGADRIANAVAAVAAYGKPVIIADFGTATTLDVVDASGVYLGGAICPGVEIARDALIQATAALPMVDLQAPDKAIGASTPDSIRSGLVYGTAALIDGLVERFREELGANAPAVATGGIAPIITEACRSITHTSLDLTLEGIRLIWERNGRAQ